MAKRDADAILLVSSDDDADKTYSLNSRRRSKPKVSILTCSEPRRRKKHRISVSASRRLHQKSSIDEVRPNFLKTINFLSFGHFVKEFVSWPLNVFIGCTCVRLTGVVVLLMHSGACFTTFNCFCLKFGQWFPSFSSSGKISRTSSPESRYLLVCPFCLLPLCSSLWHPFFCSLLNGAFRVNHKAKLR